jgi:hypothetical protein
MQIRIRETGQVMYVDEFRRTFSNLQLPDTLTEEWLNSNDADVVFQGPQALTTPPYEFSYYSGVEQVDGKWYTVNSVGPVFTDIPATDTEPAKTALEQMIEYRASKDAEQAKAVRETRDVLLAKTDWTQAKDIADSVSTSWVTYRQALRDVPGQALFPWIIEWPVKV